MHVQYVMEQKTICMCAEGLEPLKRRPGPCLSGSSYSSLEVPLLSPGAKGFEDCFCLLCTLRCCSSVEMERLQTSHLWSPKVKRGPEGLRMGLGLLDSHEQETEPLWVKTQCGLKQGLSAFPQKEAPGGYTTTVSPSESLYYGALFSLQQLVNCWNY